jgi:hypothetical protein
MEGVFIEVCGPYWFLSAGSTVFMLLDGPLLLGKIWIASYWIGFKVFVGNVVKFSLDCLNYIKFTDGVIPVFTGWVTGKTVLNSTMSSAFISGKAF